MRIVVCVKEVLDPDAVGAYAVSGGLVIGDDGKSLTQSAIPRLMNAYDEQAIEAALRLRDAGVECTISVVSIGTDLTAVLRHALALGADEVAAIEPPPPEGDHHATAALLSAYIRSIGGADLVLCGRQASDDDQGVVPALVGEELGMAVVTIARSVELAAGTDPAVVRVTRVTPNGDETVEVDCPAVVTVSSELGEPRYPTMPQKMAARKVDPTVVSAEELVPGASGSRVLLTRQFVPTLKGECEIIPGGGPVELADELVRRLVEDGLIRSRS